MHYVRDNSEGWQTDSGSNSKWSVLKVELLNQLLFSGHQSVSLHAKEVNPVVLNTNLLVSAAELFLMSSCIILKHIFICEFIGNFVKVIIQSQCIPRFLPNQWRQRWQSDQIVSDNPADQLKGTGGILFILFKISLRSSINDIMLSVMCRLGFFQAMASRMCLVLASRNLRGISACCV